MYRIVLAGILCICFCYAKRLQRLDEHLQSSTLTRGCQEPAKRLDVVSNSRYVPNARSPSRQGSSNAVFGALRMLALLLLAFNRAAQLSPCGSGIYSLGCCIPEAPFQDHRFAKMSVSDESKQEATEEVLSPNLPPLRSDILPEGFDTRVFVTGRVKQRVTPASRPLDDYMRLPVAAYATMPMPPQSALRRVNGTVDKFELDMPPMRFFHVEVKPRVFARVVPTPHAVHIWSRHCFIRGSKLIEKLELNERFKFAVDTKFTWDMQSILSESTICVDVDPPGPFARMPKSLVETTGNAVMRVAMNLIQREFLKTLGRDFERWSSDDAYRDERERLLQQMLRDTSTDTTSAAA